MAQCYLCKEETEIYEGGDVPVCVECLDVSKAKCKLLASEHIHPALLRDFLAERRLHVQNIKNECSSLTIGR